MTPDRRGDARFFWCMEKTHLAASVRLRVGLETAVLNMWPVFKGTRGKWTEMQKWAGTSEAPLSLLVTDLNLCYWNDSSRLSFLHKVSS